MNSAVNILSGLPLNALDSSDDTSGTGEKIDRWTLYGSAAPFDKTSGNPTTIPCYTLAAGKFAKSPNCIVVAGVGTDVNFPTACINAANSEAPGPSGVTNNSGVAQLIAIGCYAVGGSAMVPPAQGTFGTMGRNELRAKGFAGWNASVTKDWKFLQMKAAYRAVPAPKPSIYFNQTQYAGIGANLGSPAAFSVRPP